MAIGVRSVVLVEGNSDRSAVAVVARRVGIDLVGLEVEIVSMDGATNVQTHVARHVDELPGVHIFGLCDVAETGWFERAFDQGGIDNGSIFVCDRDLEDEFIRAVGVEAMIEFIDSAGEARTFDLMRNQPAQRGRPVADHLHRFMGARSGRKLAYATGLAELVDLDQIPSPLVAVLEAAAN